MVNPTMSANLSQVIVKRRGSVILGPIDLTLARQGITIVLGPNGAGKTTLLKVLHGVERISSGSVDWSVPDELARQSQAFIFQKPTMLRRSVRENLAYPLQLLDYKKAEIAERVALWAHRIDLGDMLDRSAPRLSGGEQQKLALGRALIRDPDVLFLDEPCANLDARSTREIEKLLVDAQSSGTRIIMTTHNIGQARRLANDVLFLLNGKLHEQGAALAFFKEPKTPEAKSFLEGNIVE